MATWLIELSKIAMMTIKQVPWGKVVETVIKYAPKVIGLIKEAKDLFSNNKADIDNVAKETYKKGAQTRREHECNPCFK